MPYLTGAWRATAGYDRYSIGAVRNGDYATMGFDPVKTTLGGVNVDETFVFVAPALNGDANLDGVLDQTDYYYWLEGYEGGTGVSGWMNGDFNYDGATDVQDLAILQANGVPEPCTLALLGSVALGLLAHGRWRRRAAQR